MKKKASVGNSENLKTIAATNKPYFNFKNNELF